MESNSFSSSLAICLLILFTFQAITAAKGCAEWKAGSNSKPRCTKEAIERHCNARVSTSTPQLHDLARVSIKLAMERVENVHNLLFLLYRSNISTPSYMRERYFSCFKNYVDAKADLERARTQFLGGEYVSAGRELADAMNQGHTCESVYSDRSFKGVSEFLSMNRKFEQFCCIGNAASSCLTTRPKTKDFLV